MKNLVLSFLIVILFQNVMLSKNNEYLTIKRDTTVSINGANLHLKKDEIYKFGYVNDTTIALFDEFVYVDSNYYKKIPDSTGIIPMANIFLFIYNNSFFIDLIDVKTELFPIAFVGSKKSSDILFMEKRVEVFDVNRVQDLLKFYSKSKRSPITIFYKKNIKQTTDITKFLSKYLKAIHDDYDELSPKEIQVYINKNLKIQIGDNIAQKISQKRGFNFWKDKLLSFPWWVFLVVSIILLIVLILFVLKFVFKISIFPKKFVFKIPIFPKKFVFKMSISPKNLFSKKQPDPSKKIWSKPQDNFKSRKWPLDDQPNIIHNKSLESQTTNISSIGEQQRFVDEKLDKIIYILEGQKEVNEENKIKLAETEKRYHDLAIEFQRKENEIAEFQNNKFQLNKELNERKLEISTLKSNLESYREKVLEDEDINFYVDKSIEFVNFLDGLNDEFERGIMDYISNYQDKNSAYLSYFSNKLYRDSLKNIYTRWIPFIKFIKENRYIVDKEMIRRILSFEKKTDKINHLSQYLYEEVWSKMIGSHLIFFEECRNIVVFTEHENSQINELCNRASISIDRIIHESNNLLNLVPNYARLFDNYETYSFTKLLNREPSYLYKNIQVPKEHIIELVQIGFSKLNGFEKEETLVIIQI